MSEPTTDWTDGEHRLEIIETTSRGRRAAPQDFFIEFLEDLWSDNTAAEAMAQWNVKVEQFPWYAADALHCLRTVIEDPPSNLVEILQRHGSVFLFHEAEGLRPPREYTRNEYIDWLRRMYEDFREVYDSAVAGTGQHEAASPW
jgi:hypothetical protein